MLHIEYYAKTPREGFHHRQFVKDNHFKEWSSNIEIQRSFAKPSDYFCKLLSCVTVFERDEWYLFDDNKIVGMVCVTAFDDVHYDRLAGATLLWVLPEYRGNKRVLKFILDSLKASAVFSDCNYYVRTSKVTPFITKQIVRRV